jgi:hypothetical protein
VKAITLWQPWASLLARQEYKKYETRGWETFYRGPIAIHAAQKPFNTGSYLDRELHPFAEALELPDIYSFDILLPYGCIIATGELVGCHKMVLHGGRGISSTDAPWLETEKGIYYPSQKELMFGDWRPGRFALEFANMKLLPEPIPAKGKQGLWEWNR